MAICRPRRGPLTKSCASFCPARFSPRNRARPRSAPADKTQSCKYQADYYDREKPVGMKEELRVLVVDDEEMLRNLLARILEREGYSVSTASGAKQALASLEKSDFQIMVSDVKMPEMNGFELLRAAKHKYPQMAVVMMTAFGADYRGQQALGLGADGYVAKQFKCKDLTCA